MTLALFDGNVVGTFNGTVLDITAGDELGSLQFTCDAIELGISLESFEGISVVDDGPLLDKRDGFSEVKLGIIDGVTLATVGIFIFDAVGIDDVNDDGTMLSLQDGIEFTSTVGFELIIEDANVDNLKLGITDGNVFK